MQKITVKQLLEAGVHFGHQTKRWNPKMGKYIFGEKNGIYIINLELTLECLHRALEFLKKIGAEGKEVLFVGTKKQAKEVIREAGVRCGMPYVHERWLGGMLTNFEPVRKSVARLEWIDQMEQKGDLKFITKKEAAHLIKERDKLVRYLSGVRRMKRLPQALFIIDTKKEEISLKEARRLGIPTVALIDTNCDPEQVDYPIPGNDDAIRAVKLFCDLVSEAIQEGRNEYLKLYPEAAKSDEELLPAAAEAVEAKRKADEDVGAPEEAGTEEVDPAGATAEEIAARFEREKLETEMKLRAKRVVRAKEVKKI